eukprot:CAMPEP_0170190790 /NCGR_PEP_ID=MMETSP0040_2-20121228/50162_1 /TAXON_ID=641309 /ORGANISM="Lotharella oceanica, Strain CCMP622" /LENGTH=247 /DNA_ID=CAMNT_0010438729 /DNA_START=30 /DNA_END=773 /DNA_ORIENTATION=+
MAARAIELLNLPKGKPLLLLDIGCGSAISSAQLGRSGHVWVGFDISRSMLELARGSRLKSGDVAEADIGQGMPLRAGVFDGAISISAVQWLCVKQTPDQDPARRLKLFFKTLRKCLAFDARAVLQVYPENTDQMDMLATAARNAGFEGGIVVDYPRSMKAKKFYLCLWKFDRMPSRTQAMTSTSDSLLPPTVQFSSGRKKKKGRRKSKIRGRGGELVGRHESKPSSSMKTGGTKGRPNKKRRRKRTL